MKTDEPKRLLKALFRIGEVLQQISSLGNFLNELLDLFIDALEVERGVFIFFDPEYAFEPIVRELKESQVDSIKMQFSKGAVEETVKLGKILLVEDVSRDERFKLRRSIQLKNIVSLLCVPIRVNNRLFGAIYVDHRQGLKKYSESELEFVNSLSQFASIGIQKAIQYGDLGNENTKLKSTIRKFEYEGLIGNSDQMQELFQKVEKIVVNPVPITILIEGENGTGKSKIAQLIHKLGPRNKKPFVTFDSGSCPESLVESTLFGHTKGSFTGANKDRKGLFDEADEGVFFLDDVNNLSPHIQTKLLTVLQERSIRPIGGKTKTVDVQVICASNKNLKQEVDAGSFREDLYYRLNWIQLSVPPLRDRAEDIPLLAKFFLEKTATQMNKSCSGFDQQVMRNMMSYDWPGNIRELISEITHAVTMADGSSIRLDDLRTSQLKTTGMIQQPKVKSLDDAIKNTTTNLILQTLQQLNGNISKTARKLGVSRGKFYDLVKKYKIQIPEKKQL